MNYTPFEERKRRVEAVQYALVMLEDGQEHSSRELFARPEGATSKTHPNYAKADLAWQSRALTTLFDLGLIVRTGAHGPTRKYKLAQDANLDAYLSEEGAATLIWGTGAQMLEETPARALSETNDADDASGTSLAPPPDESAPEIVEPVPVSIDPSQALLGKLLGVLEGFAERLTVIEQKIDVPRADFVKEHPETVGLAVRLLLTETLNETVGPRLTAIEAHLARPTASDPSALAPALDAMGKQLVDLGDAMKTLQTDMTKQVNRTQDVATKQVVDKKRFDDLCWRIDDLSGACGIVVRETSKLIVSLREYSETPPPPNLAPLVEYASKKRSGRG